MFARQQLSVCRCTARTYTTGVTNGGRESLTLLYPSKRPTSVVGVQVPGTSVSVVDLSRIANRRKLVYPSPEESVVVRDWSALQSVVWLRYGDERTAEEAIQGIAKVILNGSRLRPTFSRRGQLPRQDTLVAAASVGGATPASRNERRQDKESTSHTGADEAATRDADAIQSKLASDGGAGRAVSIEGLPPQAHPRVLANFLRGYDLVEDPQQQFHRVYGNGDRSCWLVRLKTEHEAHRLAKDANHSYSHLRRERLGDYVLRARVFS